MLKLELSPARVEPQNGVKWTRRTASKLLSTHINCRVVYQLELNAFRLACLKWSPNAIEKVR